VEDVKAHFPWTKRSILVRLGGVYSGGSRNTFAVNDEPIINFGKGEHDLLLLSFNLRAPDGSLVLGMEENMFVADPVALHDLEVNTGSTKIKAWFAKGDVGLQLFFKRLTMEELNEVLIKDRQRAPDFLPPEIRSLVEECKQQPPYCVSELPEESRELGFNDDQIGFVVRKWATANCLDDELPQNLCYLGAVILMQILITERQRIIGCFDLNPHFVTDLPGRQ